MKDPGFQINTQVGVEGIWGYVSSILPDGFNFHFILNPLRLSATLEHSFLSISFFLLSLLLRSIKYCHVTRVMIVDLGEQKSRVLKLHSCCFFSFYVCLTHIGKYTSWICSANNATTHLQRIFKINTCKEQRLIGSALNKTQFHRNLE